jgi:hypothetical protein
MISTFVRFGIDPKHHDELVALITKGKRPCEELCGLLRTARSYRRCLNHLLDEMAKPTIGKHFTQRPKHASAR